MFMMGLTLLASCFLMKIILGYITENLPDLLDLNQQNRKLEECPSETAEEAGLEVGECHGMYALLGVGSQRHPCFEILERNSDLSTVLLNFCWVP